MRKLNITQEEFDSVAKQLKYNRSAIIKHFGFSSATYYNFKKGKANKSINKTDALNQLGLKYSKNKSIELRNEIIVALDVPLRQAIYNRRIPQSLTDDIYQIAVILLMKRIENFNPKSSNFRTYSINMIKYAISDAIRQIDDSGRLVRSRNKRFEDSRLVLSNLLGYLPSDQEVESFSSLQAPDPIVVTQSMDADHKGSSHLAEENPGSSTLYQKLGTIDKQSYAQLVRNFDEMVHFFDLESRTILFLYYFKSRTMKEIGSIYGLSESRLSQMHSVLIERLRSRNELLKAA